MKAIVKVAYRYPTHADFFNIYKPPGTEDRGRGQTYIDFPTRRITVQQWEDFFSGISGLERGSRTHGPLWKVPVHSVGMAKVDPPQTLEMYQRRAQSVVVSAGA